MNKRNLLDNPCWSADDLGQALPNSPHAVSVALPRWEDVIAYEEKDPKCLKSLRSIYPRFGQNPLISKISSQALKLQGISTGSAWPFANIDSAKKAKVFCTQASGQGEVSISEVFGLQCLIASPLATPFAKAFWQHTGLGASSRLAAIALNIDEAPSGERAKKAFSELTHRLAKIYSCNASNIQLHPSGMAALSTALDAIFKIKQSNPTLQIGFPYVDVLKLPEVIYEGSDLCLKNNPKEIEKVLDQNNPSAVIVELPSNPMLQCVDLPIISKLAHERDIPLIADDTIGSPINIDALPYADIVFSSLTKSFAGRGDILAGALVISPYSKWNSELTKVIPNCCLAPLSPPDAIALEEASRDVLERIPKLNKACLTLKSQLEEHPAIKRVLHPGNCKNFEKLMRPKAGHGCLLSFELKGGLEKTKVFYDALEVCKGPSLGTNFTLACPYVLLAHYNELKWAESCGVPKHLMRVSVGLEDPEKLWQRFEKALAT